MASHKKTSRLNSSVLTGYLYVGQYLDSVLSAMNLRQLKLLKHTGVQNTKDTNLMFLAL